MSSTGTRRAKKSQTETELQNLPNETSWTIEGEATTIDDAQEQLAIQTTAIDDAKERLASQATATVDAAKDKAADTVQTVKEKAEEMAEGAVQAVDDRRMPTAEALKTAASKLHEQANAVSGGAETVAQFAHKAADKLDRTANYVRDHDTRAMIDDTRSFLKEHPRASLAAAATFGFIVGRMFWRNRD